MIVARRTVSHAMVHRTEGPTYRADKASLGPCHICGEVVSTRRCAVETRPNCSPIGSPMPTLLARLIGVGRAVVRKFVEMGSIPRIEHLERIREWAADRPAAEIPAGEVALALLVEELARGPVPSPGRPRPRS